MTLDATTPRSRRTILGAVVGAGAATLAQALGRPHPAAAANGDPVTVGGYFVGTAATSIEVTVAQPAIVGYSTATTGTSDGVRGEGYSPSGLGVYGIARATSGGATGVRGDTFSPSGTGVYGRGGSRGVSGYTDQAYGRAVEGYAYSTTAGQPVGVSGGTGHVSGIGVLGQNSLGGCAILGSSGSTIPVLPTKTGVFGYASQDANARGVTGQSTSGRGVNGLATTGRGVHGQATSGQGVRGYATSGTAVYAGSADPKSGYALRAVGRVRFDQCAGLATINTGDALVTVTPGIDLTTSSAVVATLNGNAGANTAVKRIAVNTTTNTFTIYLTAASTANVKVAWHVFG